MPKEIKEVNINFNDIEFDDNANSDCGGFTYSWLCPDCGDKIIWAPDMWWSMDCCRKWDFKVTITGKKRD
jgi:hypothetical protein